jgi:2-polyprenyl-3-methyl-5-hydroxy-6-metoxy-1,4-benzoquinol methylase
LSASNASTGGSDDDGAPLMQIGILVVAFNAESTLEWVFERIPTDFRSRISAILISDDESQDDTHAVGLALVDAHPDLPISVIRQPKNLGYGGNQKFGYRWAIEQGLDVIVLLHGDGQYAPEVLPQIVAPIVDPPHEADVVLGSRMMQPGGAREGGMPLYKFIGNRILTTVQNRLTELELSEWHSGYRAFSVPALARIPLEQCSDGFDFDTEVLLHLYDDGARIIEIPIPTYYGDEISHVNGMRYAFDVVTDVARYRAHRIGFGVGLFAGEPEQVDVYEPTIEPSSSQGRLLSWAAAMPAGRVLDLGCADGSVATRLNEQGHTVTGIDTYEAPGVKACVDHFVIADLDRGVPAEAADDGPFDIIVVADVLEHLREPGQLLSELHDLLAPGGRVLVSVPNFSHWYVRARVASGHFNYDRRGILDRGHLRFFTARTLERLIVSTGWHATKSARTGLPFGVADRGGRSGTAERLRALAGRVDDAGVRRWPSMFAYQLLYELEPSRPRN